MLKLGIIGYPLEQTLSPVMHTAALQYLNINGHYRAYEVSENELKETFEQLKTSGMKGFNVTIPHKISIIPLLDELTDTAKLVGAVNTVTFKENGKSVGDNTDAMGFWEAIPEDTRKRISLEKEKNISIVGCGGSAKAIAIALLLNNTKHIKVYGRDKEKLTNFKNFLDSKIEIDLLKNIDLSKTSLLINTTPIGMHPKINSSPVSIQELKKLPSNAIVYDIIYNPPETKLLQDASSLNLKTINGIEMLIRQGAHSLRIWLEQDIAPLGAMRLAVLQSFK